ncbi:cell division protein FtsN [Sphingomonas naasensis]|uniref:SPOR domain-containing protein n=1 Tax=Sphingomonas naasensis TaxID=1344951 RepID=UPI00141B62B4|nr:SPOR domain-containing protein [Sphingomonas naasensis]NIJ20191.1 cell division protein FtsN [Sphingomonas naasensis]
MTDTDSAFPIALIKRRRGRAWLCAALASLPLVGAAPILGIAQASRQAPALAPAAPVGAPASAIDRPATITLGALIEEQRRERARRRATGEAEQKVADLPPDEGWQAQLGAFSSPEAAERQRARLIEAGVPVVVEQTGALHRLQSRPAPRGDTEGICARAQASGIDCFVRQAEDSI